MSLKDPTGHTYLCDEECEAKYEPSRPFSPIAPPSGGGGGNPSDELDKDDGTRKPGDPRCKAEYCSEIEDLLTYTALEADSIAWAVSLGEAVVADFVYLVATGVCIASEFVGCGPGYAAALQVDMNAAIWAGFIENSMGWVAFGATGANDILLGNTGFDKDIGPYVGVDTVVSARNAVVGMLPESNIDFLVSQSQLDYDFDRLTGEKVGGFVPIFSLEFLDQLLFKDW